MKRNKILIVAFAILFVLAAALLFNRFGKIDLKGQVFVNEDSSITIGLYNDGKFYLDTTGNGSWDKVSGGDTFYDFGIRSIQATAMSVVGDWDGDGADDIGLYNDGKFYLDTTGNGKWDKVSGGDTFYDFGINSIRETAKPFIGDWDGDGADNVGLYNQGKIYLDVTGNGKWDKVSGGDAFYDAGIDPDSETAMPILVEGRIWQSCGNGMIDPGEECNEPGLSCAPGQICNATTCLCEMADLCGNGQVDPGEECGEPGLSCNVDERCESCLCIPMSCGDGIIDPGEECDDGNIVDGDGCSSECTIELPLPALCGNGIVETPEECDDGNTTDGDGCSSSCMLELPQLPGCGNATIDPGEECEQGILMCTGGEVCEDCMCVAP